MVRFYFDGLFPHRRMIWDLGNFRAGAVVTASPIGDASHYRHFGCNDHLFFPWAITFEVTAPKDFIIDVPQGDSGASRGYIIVFPDNPGQPGWYHFHDKPITKFMNLLDQCSRLKQQYLDAKSKDPRDLAQQIDDLKATQAYLKKANEVQVTQE